MALDGAFTSINGAFDAAIRGLIQSADAYLLQNRPEAARTPPHLMNVSVFGERMTKLQAYGFDAADLNDAVRSATDRGDDQKNPSGWLEQFRRVRNLPMHENTQRPVTTMYWSALRLFSE